MSALSALVVHKHASVQELILKILAQAGITSAIAMTSIETALGHMNRVAVDLLLLDVHACRTEPHLIDAVAGIRHRHKARLGLMAGHRDGAMPPVPHDFVLRKPFGSAWVNWRGLSPHARRSHNCPVAPTPLTGIRGRMTGGVRSRACRSRRRSSCVTAWAAPASAGLRACWLTGCWRVSSKDLPPVGDGWMISRCTYSTSPRCWSASRSGAVCTGSYLSSLNYVW